jgi:hypothetical protein
MHIQSKNEYWVIATTYSGKEFELYVQSIEGIFAEDRPNGSIKIPNETEVD